MGLKSSSTGSLRSVVSSRSKPKIKARALLAACSCVAFGHLACLSSRLGLFTILCLFLIGQRELDDVTHFVTRINDLNIRLDCNASLTTEEYEEARVE